MMDGPSQESNDLSLTLKYQKSLFETRGYNMRNLSAKKKGETLQLLAKKKGADALFMKVALFMKDLRKI